MYGNEKYSYLYLNTFESIHPRPEADQYVLVCTQVSSSQSYTLYDGHI